MENLMKKSVLEDACSFCNVERFLVCSTRLGVIMELLQLDVFVNWAEFKGQS